MRFANGGARPHYFDPNAAEMIEETANSFTETPRTLVEEEDEEAEDERAPSEQVQGIRVDHYHDQQQNSPSAIGETAKEITRQIGAAGSRLFSAIEQKKADIEDKKRKSSLHSVKPDELDFEPVTRTLSSKKKPKDRFVGTAVIAVVGVKHGVGTTHTAIMIANHLADQDYSVALVEANNSKDFVQIECAYEGAENANQFKNSTFNINGVKYFKSVSELKMVRLLTGNFTYIILDLGSYEATDWYDEFLRANIQIVVGSGSEWKQQDIYRFFDEQIHHDQSKWKLCIPFIQKQVIGDIKKRLPKRKVFALPHHPDPYHKQKEIDAVLEDALRLNQHQKLTMLKKKMQAIFQK